MIHPKLFSSGPFLSDPKGIVNDTPKKRRAIIEIKRTVMRKYLVNKSHQPRVLLLLLLPRLSRDFHVERVHFLGLISSAKFYKTQ